MVLFPIYRPDCPTAKAEHARLKSITTERMLDKKRFFDIDNTLVPHGAPADERAKKLFAHLKELGFSCCLLSNNKEPRVKMFNDDVQVQYIFKAGKPKCFGYEKAMERMGTDRSNTLFVGDQIFTDVCGANRTGIRTIMVRYIHPKEEIQIVLKRKLEKIVLFFYRRYQKRTK